ncbi:MAG TPA: hypothetical protein ENI62_00615 [Gammaproteobacteria bacterium]|nr:hypothetical protein [Gammaproteobacteria bacterium]
MHDEEVDQIRQNGWRQGCILPKSLVEVLVANQSLQAIAENEFYIVISHDCDVTNRSFEIEPSVELLKSKVLLPKESDGHRAWGKNPRFHQLECNLPVGKCVCEFSIYDRTNIPRKYLATQSPDNARVLDHDGIRALALWLARRYVRSAFPDEFVERSRAATDGLRKKLKKLGDLLTAIYIVVVQEELPEDSPYEIILYGSMRVDDYALSDRREDAQQLLNDIETALADCDGIEVEESHLKPEDKISLDDRRKLVRWDFDDLTVRGRAVAELPPID